MLHSLVYLGNDLQKMQKEVFERKFYWHQAYLEEEAKTAYHFKQGEVIKGYVQVIDLEHAPGEDTLFRMM